MRSKSVIYFLLGLYTALVSWYYYHSVILLILHWIFWPIALLYFLITGHLAEGRWLSIPKHYFN